MDQPDPGRHLAGDQWRLALIEHFSRLVSNQDIAANSCNLSVSGYAEQKDEREAVNITQLDAEIARIVARQSALRKEIDTIVAELEGSNT